MTVDDDISRGNASEDDSPESGFGHRNLYDIPILETDAPLQQSKILSTEQDPLALVHLVSRSIVGKDLTFRSPFGHRKIVYCDYTASGRALSFIEDYIQDVVLPHYGNTHTTISVTALQMTMFREEARSIVRRAVNASEGDAVLFCGNGSTAGFNKLVHAMNLKEPPIVFVGPYEHHSALLPWREAGAEVIMTPEDSSGHVDLSVLEEKLLLKSSSNSGRIMIGCFSAASNISGILTDTDAVTILLHRYGAVAIWDYSASAPYVDINMNPLVIGETEGLAAKDAVVFSTHKFVGGVGASGILVAKKKLFQNPVPSNPGGGTVFFVDEDSHRYLKEIQHREEGGTPGIVQDIRCGLVLRLKSQITPEVIMGREREIIECVNNRLGHTPNLDILGNINAERIPIYSFLIRHPESGRFLHHNYISALLNDLFGIQSRSGCACAGPYAQSLMGIDLKLAKEFANILMEDSRLEMYRFEVEFSQREVLRPGFVRINFPYFFSPEEIDFVCKAVEMVAEHGWKLLPLYRMNPETGEWRHRGNTLFEDRIWLSSFDFLKAEKDIPERNGTGNKELDFDAVLKAAEKAFHDAVKSALRNHTADQETSFDEKATRLRWFLLPSEAARIVLKSYPLPELAKPVFCAKKYGLKNGNSKEVGMGDGVVELSSLHVDAMPEPVALCPLRSSKKKDAQEVGWKWHSPTKEIWKPMLTAISEFEMIKDGDRILVCLSGGKDSLSLLHAMRQYKFFAKSLGINVEVGAVTVDPGSSLYDPSPLIPYLKSLGVPYFYEKQGILNTAMGLDELNSICSFCSRMKRGRLYAAARREGYNVLAFGQHLDDLAESFFMSIFHNGRLRTMKASYLVEEGDLRMIRPFVYVREKDTRSFAESKRLPIIYENCPACFEAPKERFRVKQLLASQELLYPMLYDTLKTALKPLMGFRITGSEKLIPEIPSILDEVFRKRLAEGIEKVTSADKEDE